MYWASPVTFQFRVGDLNSSSAPNFSFQRDCEYEFMLVSRSDTEQRNMLRADWQEEISSRVAFARDVDLFLCNRVEWKLSSAESGSCGFS